jgi:hypothetical protein
MDEEGVRKLLKQALPKMELEEPRQDLWPAVLRKIDERGPIPWYDVVLAGTLVLMGILFPAAFPVLLYYM